MIEVCLYIDGRRVGEEEVGECRCCLYPIFLGKYFVFWHVGSTFSWQDIKTLLSLQRNKH